MQTLNNKRSAKQGIEKAFDSLLSQVAVYLEKPQVDRFNSVFAYIVEKSNSEEPSLTIENGQILNTALNNSHQIGSYPISHAISIAQLLVTLKVDAACLNASLLRCLGDDCYLDDIRELFGDELAELVNGVSKIGLISSERLEQKEAENYRRMLLAVSKDIRVIIIELADCLHTMQTLDSFPSATRSNIAQRTLEIFAPIAGRLGLYHWSRELKELCFRHLYPKRYKALSDGVKKRDGNRKEKVSKLRSSLQSIVEESNIYGNVLGRKKSVYSIYQKMLNKKLSFEELKDIYGFRIIVDNVDDCYRTLGVVHNHYKPVPGRFSDYIAIPKYNGYQSLHTVVISPFGDTIEVQIRTEEMHQIAESGIAAHWLYKSQDKNNDSSENPARQWLIDLLDPNHHTSNPTEFLEYLKMDLYSDEVYVFTPKGDIKRLPKGATALDFAYAVHTDVGSKCSSVTINGQMEHLSKVLENGDQIEIVLNPNTSPNLAWLSYASTGRARANIKSALQNQKTKDALKIGKRLLDHAIDIRGFEKRHISSDQKNNTLSVLGIESWDKLLVEIGKGNRIPNLVARQIFSEADTSSELEASEDIIHISGAEGMLISYSKCCCPIPGDPILGIFTSGHGLVVHTTDCPNAAAQQKQQPDKCTAVVWDEDIAQEFPVKLRVWVLNKRASIARITSVIAENGCNINNIEVAESTEKIVPIDFSFEVKNRVHLAQVIKHLRSLNRVTKVSRQKG